MSITCTEAVSLANKFGIEENWSESCGQLTNWNNIPSKTVKKYREISELHEFQNEKNLVQLKKGAHLFIFTLRHDQSKINEPNQCLTEEQNHVMPPPAYFYYNLIR